MRMLTIEERLSRALARRHLREMSDAAMEAFYESRKEPWTGKRTRLADLLFASMSPVGNEDTQKSLDAGADVVAQLNKVLDHVEFEYQGSVVADTHIKEASDIDLLVVNKRAFGWDKARVTDALRAARAKGVTEAGLCAKLEGIMNMRKYAGDSIKDLIEQDAKCKKFLCAIYPDVDTSGSKAISVLNERLGRRVDVVNCQWFDDLQSILNGRVCPYRGIRIFNRATAKFEEVDFPFLRIRDMNTRDQETCGRFKQLIRFFKTLRADAVNAAGMKLSSFDIYSIVYAMDPVDYNGCDRLGLARKLRDFLGNLVADREVARGIKEFGGVASLFEGSEEKLRDIETIHVELTLLLAQKSEFIR